MLSSPQHGDLPGVQPGGGPTRAVELGWGRFRRWWLRRCRPGYVRRMAGLRRGHCPGCTHGVIDPRDLKYHRNVCGFWFPPEADRFAWRGRLGIARMGWVEIILYAVPCAVLAVAAGALWTPWVAVPPAGLAAFVVAFFRDPRREVPRAPGIVVAPADGVVDDIGEVEHHELLSGPAVRIGIFLSLLDVHVNRAPVAARVVSLRYRPGRHRATYRVGALSNNEQLWTLLESEQRPHRRLAVRQIAGPAARRIVCDLRTGEVLGRGQRFGLIKFGSRTELYLPRDPALHVAVEAGQRVKGGVSLLAQYADWVGC